MLSCHVRRAHFFRVQRLGVLSVGTRTCGDVSRCVNVPEVEFASPGSHLPILSAQRQRDVANQGWKPSSGSVTLQTGESRRCYKCE